ncbi:MAG: hypothetical protein DWQ47_00830 [Acidobacteria bacterium]|nr:MAG: hypothetical protein DWQ32_11290 [Acidobacteriota bacterium]REK04049.1 MAG: hypothetical protein DWQ38_00815 [Acidobacteriota bacterium]REK15211.1 MAG: hypothetical protein DWQ43_16980 [Acidobacteriota bacterium]REK46301.1 MAG: hypothetical protein DWQ47_00830 [Acidobacteriota bacterium]
MEIPKAQFFALFQMAAMVLFITANALAGTFTVSNDADSGAGSLRQAIVDANASGGDDVIEFDNSFFNTQRTIVLTSGELVVSDNLTVNGPGSGLLSISGNGSSRVFSISGEFSSLTVTISGVTVRDGWIDASSFAGGGIAVNDSNGVPFHVTLNLESVILTENEVVGGGSGGALQVIRNGALNITNSVFLNNKSNAGSGIGCGSGSGYCTSAEISNTTFEGNAAGNGGGVFLCCGNNTPNGTPINFENVAFINNYANQNGSAFRENALASISFTNVTFAGNRSNSNGATLQLARGTYVFENVTIAHNSSADFNTSGGIDDQNFSAGGITIRNSIVASNRNGVGPSDVNVTAGDFISAGHNLFGVVSPQTVITGDTTGNQIGVNPRLDPVPRFRGAATKTLALRPGSPAIDAGDPVNFEATDQRGVARPVDGDGTAGALPDIGAFERLLTDIYPANRFDFDGDGATDVSIFRPNSQPGSQWWFLRSSDQGTRGLQFGTANDVPVAADFTGDGKTDIAFWRPPTGEWFILRSEDDSFFAFPFGANGDIPAPGDFDGDGIADPAVFRPSAGTWFVFRSLDSQISVIPFGVATDQPIVADYDGDGTDDVGVFRAPDNQFWLLRSTLGVKAFQFGAPGDRTAIGDWTGDGKADVAFFRPSSSEWYVIRSEDDSFFAFPWGADGDIPAPGDYDGDGKVDPGVWRPSDSTWYIFGSSSGFEAVPFGVNGDVPLPSSVSVN